MMKGRAWIAISTALWLASAAQPALSPVVMGQLPLQLAPTLSATAEEHEETVEQLEALLAEEPDNREARLELARILSWTQRFEQSIAHYDRLLSADPEDVSARTERAEVLSWNGQYDQAEREFQLLLQQKPQHARAARGLARVYLWGEQPQRADAAFAKALSIEADSEAQAEWDQLRSEHRPQLHLNVGFFSDKDDFRRRDTQLEAAKYLRLDTLFTTRVAAIRVIHNQRKVPPVARSRHNSDRATEFSVELDHNLDKHWNGAVLVGVRGWEHATSRAFAQGRLEYSTRGGSVIGLEFERADFLDQSDSFEALQKGIRFARVGLSGFKPLHPKVNTFGQIDLLRLTDHNSRKSAYAALEVLPFTGKNLNVSLEASGETYDDPSPFYYDPKEDAGVLLSLASMVQLPGQLTLEYRGGIGHGYAKDRDKIESGATAALEGKLSWQRGDWSGSFSTDYQITQRGSRYRSVQSWARLERVF